LNKKKERMPAMLRYKT